MPELRHTRNATPGELAQYPIRQGTSTATALYVEVPGTEDQKRQPKLGTAYTDELAAVLVERVNGSPPVVRPERTLVVTSHPGRRFGALTVGGIECEVIASLVMAGESVAVVCHEYDLSRAEVLLACWFEATSVDEGERRRQWLDWATANHTAMAADRWTEVPDPPVRGSGTPETAR